MTIRIISILALSIFISGTLHAQELPIISAQSNIVDIRDGSDYIKNAWSIVPEANPDVFTSNKIGETITFYTDKDSISHTLQKDAVFDFIILLNDTDTAYTQIKYEPSYLEKLIIAEAYNSNDNTPFPQFTYQDSSDQVLKTLRSELKLDSIAGGGNQVSKIMNLMHWIHDLIPHDGSKENPVVRNAMNMIDQCKREDRGLNCRGLATVLNECYLSLGIKSRFITCMPKDSIFQDCHVINMVYVDDLEKWVWMDPTHDAYVMDETGMLLGPGEVRERLINNKTLILNPDANWNNRQSTLKEDYLYEYMAKNLYRFEVPIRSEYNYETWTNGKEVEYIELLPLDGLKQTPKSTSTTFDKTGVTFKNFKTNNPDLFWVSPYPNSTIN